MFVGTNQKKAVQTRFSPNKSQPVGGDRQTMTASCGQFRACTRLRPHKKLKEEYFSGAIAQNEHPTQCKMEKNCSQVQQNSTWSLYSSFFAHFSMRHLFRIAFQ